MGRATLLWLAPEKVSEVGEPGVVLLTRRLEREVATEATREERLLPAGDVVVEGVWRVVYRFCVCRAGSLNVMLAMLVMSRMNVGAKGSVDSADFIRVERVAPAALPTCEDDGTGT
jgi:hypothetical protein